MRSSQNRRRRRCQCRRNSGGRRVPMSKGSRVIDLHSGAPLRSQPLIKTFTFSTVSLPKCPGWLGDAASGERTLGYARVARAKVRRSSRASEMRGGGERKRDQIPAGRILIRFRGRALSATFFQHVPRKFHKRREAGADSYRRVLGPARRYGN